MLKSNSNIDNILQICLPIFIGFTIRSIVTLHPYSGQNKPPLYGDYEAQRHWMEITINLPISQWYFNSTDNDLNYWGLDYPPLTAYHSWLLGKLSNMINPFWTKLHISKGIELYEHKLFMRYTVLLSDLFLFIPAVLFYFYIICPKLNSNIKLTSFYSTCVMLIYPGLILIDHGHFQYNCISLGLFLWSLNCFFMDYHILASFIFCCSLNYKQMELYHSLPIFFYCLNKCYKLSFPNNLYLFLKFSFTVIFTFILIYLPFLNSFKNLNQIIYRLFPLARGLYEDKVSNFWCVTNLFIKWRQLFNDIQLVYLCIILILLTCLPCCLKILFNSNKQKFLFALISCSLSFYLFSFQVHEKSILLISIPSMYLLYTCPITIYWFNICSTFSLWPLIRKDHLELCFICLMIIYLIFGLFLFTHKHVINVNNENRNSNNYYWNYLYIIILSLTGYIMLICCDLFISPPLKYPDLFPFLFSAFSFIHFFLFFIFCNWNVFCDRQILI